MKDGVLARSAISGEIGDGDPCDSKDTGVIDVLETTEVPEKTRSAEAQLELNLVPAIKDNKKMFL